MIIFENKGEIDVRAIKTFGVNVKESENPIGFFGTGLKYAISILLREKHNIIIQSGLNEYVFSVNPVTIRNSEFNIVRMNNEDLGFTTDVGKQWKLWMAYRELYCNCEDEGGFTIEDNFKPSATDGVTRIIVDGDEFANIHNNSSEFILPDRPGQPMIAGYFYPGESKAVFYRGINVHQLQKPSKFTYNILSKIDLTENRTAMYDWEIKGAILASVISSKNKKFIEGCLLASDSCYERTFNYNNCPIQPSDEFIEVVDLLTKDQVANINPSAFVLYKDVARKGLTPETMTVSVVEGKMLKRALAICAQFGFDIKYDIIVTESLGSNILGLAEGGKIYLSQLAFDKGTKCVAGTILEEYLHLKHHLIDNTREMQNFLVDKIITMMEQATGEPL